MWDLNSIPTNLAVHTPPPGIFIRIYLLENRKGKYESKKIMLEMKWKEMDKKKGKMKGTGKKTWVGKYLSQKDRIMD